MTNRLSKHIGTLIHPDQTGFIPERLSFSNTRRLLNIMYSTNPSDSAVISLDAKQAFDQIEWRYMFATLRKFGFGDKFMTLLKMLYACPKSSVLTNHDRSPPFLLQRGTRQGCSLSPLLFALALEPLAISIRSCPQIVGIGDGISDSPIGLYADDVILTLSDVRLSLSPLLSLIKNFGQLSGFTINWEKSLFMPLSDGLDSAFLNSLPFKVSTEYFTYLGVNITRNPKLLFKLNFADLIGKLKIMIDRWKLLPLSLIGRVNIVKMVVLPKFMYLFQNIPIYLTTSFFKMLDSIVIPFIWADKPSRISKAHLQKSTAEGGLGLPVFRHYYWACNARALVVWSHFAASAEQAGSLHPIWPEIETHVASVRAGASLAAILFSKQNLPFRCFKDDFVMRNTFKILQQIKGVLDLPGVSTYAPICQNPYFKPGMMDAAFVQWSDKGLTAIIDLYINDHFATFAQLQTKFGLPSSHFFRYLQVRNFVRQSIPHFETLPEQHVFYELMTKPPTSKRLISQFVSLFSLAAPSLHIKEAWVSDIGEEISDVLWAQGLTKIKSCSINARLQLIQFKVIHRLHFSKTRLNRIFPSVSAICDKCKSDVGTLGHLFCSCPKLRIFWHDIFNLYSVIYSEQLTPDSLLIILGCSKFSLTLPSSLQQALMFGMVVAKRVILRDWKSASPPCFKKWLNDMVSCIYLEEIRYTLSDAHHKFLEVWGPFIEYIRSDKLDPLD
uniref:Reverse transcriptase domain-containing protein n=1 Tax=Sparus aurata TaxID=8175 RepID=A0A671XVP2_SPAAU